MRTKSTTTPISLLALLFVTASLFYASCKKNREPIIPIGYSTLLHTDINSISDTTLRSIAKFVEAYRTSNKNGSGNRFSDLGTPLWSKCIIVPGPGNPEYVIPFTKNRKELSGIIIVKKFENLFRYKLYNENPISDKNSTEKRTGTNADYAKTTGLWVYVTNYVFGTKEFNLPCNVFKTKDHSAHKQEINSKKPTFRKLVISDIKLPSAGTSTIAARWDYFEFCVSSNGNCTCPASWGTCDWCKDCVATTCWGSWVNFTDDAMDPRIFGGGGGGGGGGGWITGYYDPVCINGVCYSTSDYPGINEGFSWKWWENSQFLETYGGLAFGTWAINYISNNPTISFNVFKNQFMTVSEGLDDFHNKDFWDDPNNTFPPQNLPSWALFEAAFPKRSDPLYDTPSKLYSSIGGAVVAKMGANSNANTCAARVSKALNYSGVVIPHIPNQTYKGSDGKYYFLGAENLNRWMRKTFGCSNPNKAIGEYYNSNSIHFDSNQIGLNGSNLPNYLSGIKGIFSLVSYNYSWATGHADLMYSTPVCDGGCHFDGPIKYIDVWKLK